MLKDETELWGTPVIALKEYSRKFKWQMFLLVLGDIFVIFLTTFGLWSFNISYQAYGFVVLIVSLAFHFGLYNLLRPDRWETFNFWRRHGEKELHTLCYNVEPEQLYSVLFCSGYRRLKTGQTEEYYKALFYDACCESSARSGKLMKFLDSYKDENGSLAVTVVSDEKHNYFIKF